MAVKKIDYKIDHQWFFFVKIDKSDDYLLPDLSIDRFFHTDDQKSILLGKLTSLTLLIRKINWKTRLA